jgi:hypothetical protein
MLKKYVQRLEDPVSITPLITFRIIFGALMIFSVVRFMTLGWIEDHYLTPLFHFKYYGFEWVHVLSPFWMYTLHVLMLLGAVGVMLGLYYRISSVILFLSFTYTELIDLTYYLNHYYFVSIVCGLLIVVPANRSFSIDVLRKPALAVTTIPAWCIVIFKLQLAIVYSYAGIAKINTDWLLHALPMKIWMPANDQLPIIGSLLALPVMPYVFSWLGMVYDCTIVLWLSNRKTRAWAYVSVVFFHGVTGMMFQIGVFPLVMMGATLIFFSVAWHTNVVNALRSLLVNIFRFRADSQVKNLSSAVRMQFHASIKILVALHFLFQILFPLRYLTYPGNLFWTEEGYRFSWRVMLMEKAGTATFYVKDSKTGREGVVVNSEFLNPNQEKQMAMQPDMVLQYAHFLKSWYESKGVTSPQVRAEVYVTLNARPSKLLFDPAMDLTTIKDNWKPKTYLSAIDK